MFQDFQALNLYPMTVGDIIINISVALLCGYLISLLYRYTYKGPGYSVSFVHAIVLLSMITAIVLMVIGNNLARAFGLVGAMSIIRFRTAVKETRDIVFIFYSLAIGMAAGVGYHLIAITGTLFVGTVLFLFSKTSVASPQQKEFLLQFYYTPNGDYKPPYDDLLKRYCRKTKVINVKSLQAGDLLELSYYVKLRDQSKNSAFVNDLSKLDGVDNINLFYDDEKV